MTNDRRIRWITFVAALFACSILSGGHPRNATDTPLYVSLADGMRTGDVSGIVTLSAARWSKATYLTILALARSFAGGQWTLVMMFVNILCSALTAVLLVDLVRRATRWRGAWVFALISYLVCWDIWSWLPFVVTDVMYTLVAFVPFALVARRLIIDGEPFRPFLLTASLVIVFFTRPPGIVIIPLVLFVELVFVRRRVRGRTAALTIMAAAVLALLVRTAVVQDPARWPFRFLQPKLVEFSGREKAGEVMQDRKESYRPPPHTMADHVAIESDRFVRFFQVTAPTNSRRHNLISLVFFVPLYSLALLGAGAGLAGCDRHRINLVITLLVWIGVFAFFHALTILDYDWRFRLPLLPQMILLAACGADALAARWRPQTQA